jgi:hypothetical protein
MELELKTRDDTEVAAASTQRPKELLVLLLGRTYELAVGRDDISGNEVVDCHTVLAAEPPKPAAQGQPGDTGCRVDPHRCRQTESLSFVIEVSQRRARSNMSPPFLRVHTNGLHKGKVDHEPTFAHRVAGDVVSCAVDSDESTMLARETDGLHDISGPRAASDQSRPLVDHCVPDLPGIIVAGVARLEQLPAEALSELLHCGLVYL